MTRTKIDEVIVNSSASEHVVGDIQLLQVVKKVPNVNVELPDGQRVVATQKGKLSMVAGSDYVKVISEYTWHKY